MTLLAVVRLGRGVVPVDEPVFHADDEGVLRGRAVFETLRVYGGRPFRLDEHLARLAASAERVGLPDPDAAFERLEGKVELVHGMKTMPWGNKTFQFRDPEGTAVSLYMPFTEAARQRFEAR